MKRMLLAVAMVAPMVCMAATKDDAAQWERGLNELQGHCQVVGLKIAMDQDNDQMAREQQASVDHDPSEIVPNSDMLQTQLKPWGDCISAAKDSGAESYKGFVASVQNPVIKADAKKVFAAWLAYVDSLTVSKDISDGDNRQQADLRKAESEMDVDLL